LEHVDLLAGGPVALHTSILLNGGFVKQMEGWNVKWIWAMGKLNRDIVALTFGTKQIPPYATAMLKKKKQVKYKQYQWSLQSNGDWAL
jgi:hypothetical protein